MSVAILQIASLHALPRVVVLSDDTSGDAGLSRDVADAVREALAKAGTLDVAPRALVESISSSVGGGGAALATRVSALRDSNVSSMVSAQSTIASDDALAQARTAFLRFDNKHAIALLDPFLANLRNESPRTPPRDAAYADALALRAMIAQSQGDRAGTTASLSALLHHAPIFTFDAAAFPPSLRAEWTRVQAAAQSSRTAKLQIDSKPALAEVLLNGVMAGRTPLEIAVPSGEYRVTLRGASYRDVTQRVAVRDGESRRVEMALRWGRNQNDGAATSHEMTRAAPVTSPRGASSSAASALQLGTTLHAAKVVMLRVDRVAQGEGSVRADVLDVVRGVALQPVAFAMSPDHAVVASRLSTMAGRVANLCATDIGKHPGKIVPESANDVRGVMASRSQTHAKRRRALLIALGVVVLGGIIGGVVASQGGGDNPPANATLTVRW